MTRYANFRYVKSEPEDIKILLIDDNEDIRNLVSLIVENAGFKVFSAFDGADGLQKTIDLKPDLVLLDSMMPRMTGVEVLEQIRKNKDPKISSIPIIMLTSRSSVEDIDIAIDFGVTSYVIKPFRPEKLVEKILKLLKSEGIVRSDS